MKWKLVPAAEFEQHRDAWRALNESAGASPLLEPEFVGPLLSVFGAGSELLALSSGPAGLQAAAIVAPGGRGTWETFQPSQAPIGAWLQAPGSSLPELAGSLLRALPGMPLRIGVSQQDPDLVARPADGGCTTTLDYIQTARVTIDGTFAQYWEKRGKNLRQNMRKQRNRLEKDGTRTSLDVVTDAAGIAAAIADYGSLESVGWKAEGGTAIHPDNAQGRFYRAMLENFCRLGRGRVYRYRFDDRVVVTDLCIEGSGSLIILKTTYDEGIKSLSPTFLMREEVFKALFDEGRVRRIEFYGKLMEWHTRWSEEVRTMYHATFYRWAVLPKIRQALSKFREPAAPGESQDQRQNEPQINADERRFR